MSAYTPWTSKGHRKQTKCTHTVADNALHYACTTLQTAGEFASCTDVTIQEKRPSFDVHLMHNDCNSYNFFLETLLEAKKCKGKNIYISKKERENLPE